LLSLGAAADLSDLHLPTVSTSDEYRTHRHGSSAPVPLSSPEDLAAEYPSTPAQRARAVVDGDRRSLPRTFLRRPSPAALDDGGEGTL
jgi:hypothetical protein